MGSRQLYNLRGAIEMARYHWKDLLSAAQKEELTEEAMNVWVEDHLQTA